MIWDRRRTLGATLGSTYKPLLVKLASSDRRRKSPRLNLTASLIYQDPPITYFVSKIPPKCLKKYPKKRKKRTKIGPNKCINFNKISTFSLFSYMPTTGAIVGATDGMIIAMRTFTASATATRTFIASTTAQSKLLISRNKILNRVSKDKLKNSIKISKIIRKRLEFSKKGFKYL